MAPESTILYNYLILFNKKLSASSGYTATNEQPDRSIPVSTLAKLWWGVVLPALMLCGWVVLLMATAREFMPLLLLVLSIVVVPAVMLVNCWTLFVAWRGSLPLLLVGLAIPAFAGAVLTMFIHGRGAAKRAAEAVLTPFGIVLKAGGDLLLALLAVWLLAMAGLFLWARRRAAAAAR
jgi:hypothetical protein